MLPTGINRWTKRIYLSLPHMSGREQAYVQEAFSTNWMTTVGSNLDAIESAFERRTGRYCVATSSGTAAIHLGLRLLGVGPGDEVIVPTLTFVASANPVVYLGATPVFVDSEERTWNMDPQRLKEALQSKAKQGRLPKAIVVVHLFGQTAEMGPITKIASEYGVPILEDAAEALGAKYGGHYAGTFGDVSIYSFNGNKMITGTSGGMLLAPDRAMAAKARKWSQQSRDVGTDYLHSEIGYNYRLSNLLAGVVRGQLEVLEERVAARRAIAERYTQGLASLPGFTPMPTPADHFHAHWLSCFSVDADAFGIGSTEIIEKLEVANIDSRPVWKPMHTQKLYEKHECFGGEVAERLNRTGICLPSSSSLTEPEQSFIIETIRNMHRQ